MLVAGPDIDASGGWDDAVALAEKQRLAVWATPATGGGRLGFPESHAELPGDPRRRRSARPRRRWPSHDLVLVVGSSVFPYYPYIPGPLLPEGRASCRSPATRRGRARADGRRDRRRRGARAESAASSSLGESAPRQPPARPAARRPPARRSRSAARRRWRRSPPRGPRTGSLSSRRLRARSRCATACGCRSPGSYFFSSSGGLGFGISAAVGVQLAAARATGRVRARGGLGAVRDHGAVDGGRLQASPSRSSCCATRST